MPFPKQRKCFRYFYVAQPMFVRVILVYGNDDDKAYGNDEVFIMKQDKKFYEITFFLNKF